MCFERVHRSLCPSGTVQYSTMRRVVELKMLIADDKKMNCPLNQLKVISDLVRRACLSAMVLQCTVHFFDNSVPVCEL